MSPTVKYLLALGLLPMALLWVALIGLLAAAVDQSPLDESAGVDQTGQASVFIDHSQFESSNQGRVLLEMDLVDERGEPFVGVTRDDVSVTEEDRPVELVRFRGPGTLPINVVLVIDISSSMQGSKMAGARRAAQAAVDKLRVDHDRVGIIAFDDQFEILQPLARLTGEVEAACRAKISQLRVRSGTSIGPPTQAALDMMGQAAPDGPKLVLVMTDGQDGALDAQIDTLAKSSADCGAPIHTVGFGFNRRISATALVQLAERCGGQFHHAPTSEELTTLFESRVQALRDKYTLAYDSPYPQADGLPRHVVVRVRTPDGTATTSATYEVGQLLPGSTRGQATADDQPGETVTSDDRAGSPLARLAGFLTLLGLLTVALLLPSAVGTWRRRQATASGGSQDSLPPPTAAGPTETTGTIAAPPPPGATAAAPPIAAGAPAPGPPGPSPPQPPPWMPPVAAQSAERPSGSRPAAPRIPPPPPPPGGGP